MEGDAVSEETVGVDSAQPSGTEGIAVGTSYDMFSNNGTIIPPVIVGSTAGPVTFPVNQSVKNSAEYSMEITSEARLEDWDHVMLLIGGGAWYQLVSALRTEAEKQTAAGTRVNMGIVDEATAFMTMRLVTPDEGSMYVEFRAVYKSRGII
jgi:hypothetical protein